MGKFILIIKLQKFFTRIGEEKNDKEQTSQYIHLLNRSVVHMKLMLHVSCISILKKYIKNLNFFE